MRLSPAEYVIRTIGGVRKTARAIGRVPSAVSAWRSKAGTGGEIPRGAQKDILKFARLKRLPITAEDLLLGRDVPNGNKKAKRA
jgi:hypothetical protein